MDRITAGNIVTISAGATFLATGWLMLESGARKVCKLNSTEFGMGIQQVIGGIACLVLGGTGLIGIAQHNLQELSSRMNNPQ